MTIFYVTIIAATVALVTWAIVSLIIKYKK